MTKNKARKRLVRQRTAKTGESYTTALRHLLASKGTPVDTETTPISSCALCERVENQPKALVAAGAPLCLDCYDRLRAAVVAHLEPEASRARRPLDYVLSALFFVRGDENWTVHLHTFQPALVIGRAGATAGKLRRSLVEATGDEELRLNVASHDFDGCEQAREAIAGR